MFFGLTGNPCMTSLPAQWRVLCAFWVFATVIVTVTHAQSVTTPDRSWQDCDGCPRMVQVAQGSVVLGSYPDVADRGSGEGPKRTANIAYDLAVSQTETTRSQWQAFTEATGYKTPDGCQFYDGHFGYVLEHNWRNPGFPQRPDHPVVCVSLRDAEAYAEWLSTRSGRRYRLPSATEFEYFNRAGADTPWFWGIDSTLACDYANIGDNAIKPFYPKQQVHNCADDYLHTAPVGKFKPNKFGLFDTVGNVFEWTVDCYHADFDGIPADGSAWLADRKGDCSLRSPRGGSWVSGPNWTRAAAQSRDPVDYRSFLLGFRLVTTELRK